MKKIIIFSIIAIILIAAYVTKPDDKTCIIGGVRAVWGKLAPDPRLSVRFFNQFMDLNSKNVEVKNWIFYKQIIYLVNKERTTVAFGAFNHIFVTAKPIQLKK